MRSGLLRLNLVAVTVSVVFPLNSPLPPHRGPSASSHSAALGVPRAEINDNRRAAGVQRGSDLTLHLVAREAMWHPDGDTAPGILTQAFAEDGHAPRIPGPMLRVRAGTNVSVTIRNEVPHATLIVHGLTTRSGAAPTADDSVRVEAGATRSMRFRLDAPGTYYYWGTTMGRTVDERTKADAQLTGAIVVDPADGPLPPDRVLVLGMMSDTAGHVLMVRKRLLAVINGRSWPETERLQYTVGDSVRWRLINASGDMHPMHLHGFYFRVDSRGDGLSDTTYAPGQGDQVFTNLLKPGTTMRMSWVPERPGNWLFHCHLPEHFAHRGPLGVVPVPAADHVHHIGNHAMEGMSGLVMGIIVRPASAGAPRVADDHVTRRQLRLVIRPSGNASSLAPHFEYALEDGRRAAPLAPGDHAAPAIVLTRGEPVSITVVNTLSEPSAVHWHGIELESYFDGVAGFSGDAARLSPVIAAGDSFVARFTPPRAGTFIYHTHVQEERQQPAGLAGPIIVLDDATRYDPSKDFSVVATAQREPPDSTGTIPAVAWLNGSASPAPLNLRVGEHYRLRLINITTNAPGLIFSLTKAGALLQWRPLAKDGIDRARARQGVGVARQPVSIGETADVELSPDSAGDQELQARNPVGKLLGTLSLHVTGAAGRTK